MAKQRYVNTRFWNDVYISDLDPSEKLLFLYLITNSFTNISGVYEIPVKQIALDTGFDKDMIYKITARFERDDKIIYKDGWIVILNFIKHQSTKSIKIRQGIHENLKNAPEWTKDTLLIRYTYDIIYSNSNSNSNSNLNSNDNLTDEIEFVDTPTDNPKQTKFKKPTTEQLQQYLTERKIISFGAGQFHDYYESKGWMIGKNKMKDWKAAVRTWERNDFGQQKTPSEYKVELPDL